MVVSDSISSKLPINLPVTSDTDVDAVSALMQELQQRDIRYLRFEMPDMHGVSRLKVVPVNKVEGYARQGLNFYGGTLALDTSSLVVPASGYHAERKFKDHLIFPDFSTLTPVPWLEKTAKVICDPVEYSGEAMAIAPRYVLKQVLDLAASMGFDVMMGHEFEFYLLDGKTRQPLFGGCQIFNHLRSQYNSDIETMVRYLEESNIDIITYNCEHAPSQFEINYGPAIGLAAADKAFNFKTAVKEIAHRLGYLATFMTKPYPDKSGSCCHFHISLWNKENGENAFLDTGDELGLSSTAKSFIEGILTHARGLMPMIGPTPNCYRRLKPHTFAPSKVSWGIEDRSSMVRVKATNDDRTHFEIRAASGLSNPYLTAAGVLAAGLLGIKKQLALRSTGDCPGEENPAFPWLPQSLGEALDSLAADSEMKQLLGEEFVRVFTEVKRFELDRFDRHVSDWEINEYMEVY
ncbi:MAG TPA: glutamine synthetase [Leptolyngbyaceae cyanobacterium M33_DOE_097]|uniref:glutamine synthetase n=1 Tax=Oscillatoriales cyanobacterium SpSt-418 TaxID=2282169 RepID=A0A7C3PNE5_9CYAN|nr:glutamine synthetase [Leptolyngbyaceae cyanobacterium M33_DOE_097]